MPKCQYSNKPAIIIELKVDEYVDIALEQISNRSYGADLGVYKNNMLLVGINYDKKTKKSMNVKLKKINN